MCAKIDVKGVYLVQSWTSGTKHEHSGLKGAERGADLTVKIALDVPQEHRYIGMVRKTARTLLEHHRTAEQDIADLEVVIGELCSNVTRHANSEAGCFRVKIEHYASHQVSHVVLLVVDQGQGFDSNSVPPVGEARPDTDGELRYGGFGLHLVRTLADHVDIQVAPACGTAVRVQKQLLSPSHALGG